MYNTEKKFRRSPLTTIGYVLAALMLIYTCYQIGSTIHTINEYYSQYGMKATPVEYLTYVGQNAMTPLINAVVLFFLSAIHNEVRKNNPANYLSDEDIIEAEAAKKAAKEAKQVKKGDEAAAKAGHEPVAEEAVVADFTTEAETEAAEDAKPEKTEPKQKKKSAAKEKEDGKIDLEKKEDGGEAKSGKKDDSKPEKSEDGKPEKGAAPKKSSGKKRNNSRKPKEKKEPKAEETKAEETKAEETKKDEE